MPKNFYARAPNFFEVKISIFSVLLSLYSSAVFAITNPLSQKKVSINLTNGVSSSQRKMPDHVTQSGQENPSRSIGKDLEIKGVSNSTNHENYKTVSSVESKLSSRNVDKDSKDQILLAANERPEVSQDHFSAQKIKKIDDTKSMPAHRNATESVKAVSENPALAYSDVKKNSPSYSVKAKTTKSTLSSDTEKKIMDKIYVNFLNLLNLSASTKSLTAASNKKTISENISSLEALATQLSEHPKSMDFDFIVKNFQRDTRELSSTWKAGRYRESQFIIRSLTDNCISCHTSKQSINDSSIGDASSEKQTSKAEKDLGKSTQQKVVSSNLSKQFLFQGIDDKNLNLIEKAQLKTALREFSEALNIYETAFLPSNLSAYPSLMLEGYLTDYIIVALKVKQDPTRVLATLEKIYLDPSLPYSLSMTLKKWLSTLKEFKNVDLKTIDDIEKFVTEGNQKASFPLDSGSIVTNILALNKIKSLLDQGNLSPLDQARSYLITGVCELSINRPLQISRANYYLEKAITNAPKTEIAKNAYYYLESNIFYENSGSLGVFVPQNDLDKLKSLKKLIE